MRITNRQALITKYKMEINEIDAKIPSLTAYVNDGLGAIDDVKQLAVHKALRQAYVLFIDEIKIIE